MNHKLKRVAALLAVAAALMSGCAAPSGPPAADGATGGTSGTWAWRYRTYDALSGEEYPAGKAELSGKPGSYRFRLAIYRPAPCWAGAVPATVSTDAENITITAEPLMTGCGFRRYVIRNDGTGGRAETKIGNAWVKDERDRGLTR